MTQPIDPSTYPSWLRVDDTIDLESIDTRQRHAPDGQRLSKSEGKERHRANIEVLRDLQFKMYAEHERALLVVLQAIDSGGKDGCIRRVFGPLNPQGVRVKAFKKPTSRELDHDFLWRVHQHAPQAGHIQVFNRSHYEDVLVARVHGLVDESIWRRRYEHIRNFESLLTDNRTLVVKLLLHISKDEQRERLQARVDDPTRRWKFAAADLSERKRWDDYQAAFADAIEQTTTPNAPWYVIPADRKWYRNFAISSILRELLEAQPMEWPPAEEDIEGLVVE
ncbi:MAG: PPK2 family polyphosphate kinase [Myxococcota bacterium]